jgi:type VI secretion system secreted protein Hcp
MAFDAFVKFYPAAGSSEPIEGESTDSMFKGWFEVKEFSFGIENTLNITSASSGAGAGKAEFKEFTIKKQTDKASPILASTCGKGGHYQKVELRLRKSGAKGGSTSGDVYLSYDFKLVAVKSVEWSGLVRRRRAGRNGRLRIRRAEDRLQAAEQRRHARQACRTRLEQGDQQHEFRQLESAAYRGRVISTRSQFEPTDHHPWAFLRW